MAGPAGKKAADKSDTKVEQPSTETEEALTKKRGRPAKAAADKPTDKPSESVPKPAKATEAGQESKRPRGRPPGNLLVANISMPCPEHHDHSLACCRHRQKAEGGSRGSSCKGSQQRQGVAFILPTSSMALVAKCLEIESHCLQAAMEGEGTASTNEDAEETAQPEQKKGKKKTTKTAAS